MVNDFLLLYIPDNGFAILGTWGQDSLYPFIPGQSKTIALMSLQLKFYFFIIQVRNIDGASWSQTSNYLRSKWVKSTTVYFGRMCAFVTYLYVFQFFREKGIFFYIFWDLVFIIQFIQCWNQYITCVYIVLSRWMSA